MLGFRRLRDEYSMGNVNHNSTRGHHMNTKAVLAFSSAIVICTASAMGMDDDSLPSVPEGAQAVSLFGEPLAASTPSNEAKQQLRHAKDDYDTHPNNADNIIWYGRRTAYTGDYREAIRIYTEGIQNFPADARMYRHRGHRYISIREFDRAIADLEQASKLIRGKRDVVEPDGQPNAKNIPIGSLHSNIWYHLGLAYYLNNDLDNALRVYRVAHDNARNDDKVASTSHWLYMTLRGLGRDAEAAKVLESIRADMNILENFVYQQLCLFYKGDLAEDAMTGGDLASNDAMEYGVGNWYAYNGQPNKAREVFERLMQGDSWASFGRIAAEADLFRAKDNDE
jgi:tetratricopeptide (TPR) repeat protein